MSLFLTGSYNVRVRRKISHGARWLCAIVRLDVCWLSRYPGSFAKQLDPRLMSVKDYAYISSCIY